MVVLDLWDGDDPDGGWGAGSPGRRERVIEVVRALHAAWLEPLGVRFEGAADVRGSVRDGPPIVLRHRDAACVYATVPATYLGIAVELTRSEEMVVHIAAPVGYVRLWDELADLRDVLLDLAGQQRPETLNEVVFPGPFRAGS
jgi:hypothetical protein